MTINSSSNCDCIPTIAATIGILGTVGTFKVCQLAQKKYPGFSVNTSLSYYIHDVGRNLYHQLIERPPEAIRAYLAQHIQLP